MAAAAASGKADGRREQHPRTGEEEAVGFPPEAEALDDGSNPREVSKKAGSPTSARTKGSGAPSVNNKEEAMYPPPKLGQFYDFFSFAHLSPPLQCQISFSYCPLVIHIGCSHLLINNYGIKCVLDIRLSSRPFVENKREDDFFQIDVSLMSCLHATVLLFSVKLFSFV